MDLSDRTTIAERLRVVGHLLGHQGEYGVVTALSRQVGVARQTLYTWREHVRAVLEPVFGPRGTAAPKDPGVARQILTLLVEGHASERGIQRCLAEWGRATSLGTISGVVTEAGRRALAVMAHPLTVGPRIVALDEIYGNNRQGGYLSVVDAVSGAVWQTAGPLAVDADTWTVLLWEAQERGLRWSISIGDGGAALSQAAQRVVPEGEHRRDVWHVLHTCAQVLGRLQRWATELAAQTATVARQAARVAAGQKPRGRHVRCDLVAHQEQVRHARWLGEGFAYLTSELRRLVDVVVLTSQGVLDGPHRQEELDTLLTLLAELAALAPPPQQRDVLHLHRHLVNALPALVSFAAPLDHLHQQWGPALGADGLALLAWAWQHRAILGPSTADLLEGLPPDWRPAARVVLHAWDQAVRASSLVETWHSVLRPHLAVHRTLSPGLLALLAVAHNHRLAERGLHAGTSPLQRSEVTDVPTDWLCVLGYPPAEPVAPPGPARRRHQQAA